MSEQRKKTGKFARYSNELDHLALYTAYDETTGCLEWIGPVDKDGYGKITSNYRSLRPHRLAYQILCNNNVPPVGQVNHLCHNRSCWNPGHLYEGTQQQNIDDRNNAGHTVRGENHHSAKLSIEEVRAIRKLSKEGRDSKNISAITRTHRCTIDDILTGRTWRWLDD